MSLANKMAQERRARLAAERLLEQKQAELHEANRKLGHHARKLSDEIVVTRAKVQNALDENQRVKSDLTVANEKVEIAERRLWHSIEAIQDGFAFFDDNSRMVAANPAYMAVFDGLEAVRPGVSYAEILQFMTEEGIVDIGDVTPAARRLARGDAGSLAERGAGTGHHTVVERGLYQADRPARAWRRCGQSGAEHLGHRPLRATAERGAAQGRGGQPGQIVVPGQHEP